MDDTIRRTDAIEAFNGAELGTYTDPDKAAQEIIGTVPSAEPKTGEWIQKDMCADRFCSECNYAVWDSEAEEYNFCPNCGARMNGGEEE